MQIKHAAMPKVAEFFHAQYSSIELSLDDGEEHNFADIH